MQALTATPGVNDSLALRDVTEPHPGEGAVLVDALSVGLCGTGQLNRTAVLENDVVFGTVNANRRHYLQAAEALAQADQAWLGRLITRRTRLEDFAQAFEQRDDDVKVVIDLQQE